MKIFPQGKGLTLTVVVFVVVMLSIFVVLMRIGAVYRKRINVTPGTQFEEPKLHKTKIVKSITVKKNTGRDCMQITPDGVVRVFAQCDDNLTDANRLTNTNNILKLFRMITEYDADTSLPTGEGDNVYELIIETDEGTQHLYIVIDENTPTQLQEIVQTITKIEEDIPPSSPQPSTITPSPSAGSVSPSLLPSGSVTPGAFPSPTPGGLPGQAFLCDFMEVGGKKKPINVSNIICSTDPSPLP